MKTKFAVLVVLALVLVIAALPLVSACSNGASTPTPTSKPTSTPTAKPTTSPTSSPTASPTSAANAAAEFYKGKTLTLMVGREVGADGDLMARALAPSLKKYLGASAVIVENRAEAGGIEGMNLTYVAKADGLTMDLDNLGDMSLMNILEDPAAKFEVDKFNWLWAAPPKPTFFTISAKKYKELDDLRKEKRIIFGAGAPGGNYHLWATFVAELMGLQNAKVMGGIKASDRMLRLAQGDLDGSAYTVNRVQQGMEQRALVPAFVFGPNGFRFPEFPDVPTMGEVFKPTDPKLQKAIGFSTSILIFGYTAFTTPGVPEERVAFLEEAWTKATEEHKDQIAGILQSSMEGMLHRDELNKLATEFTSPEMRKEWKSYFEYMFEKYKA